MALRRKAPPWVREARAIPSSTASSITIECYIVSYRKIRHSSGVIRGFALPLDRDQLDRLAIGLSSLCVAHCVVSSIVLALMASAGGVLLHPLIHEVGLVLAILLGLIGLGRGAMTHGARLPAGLGLAGLGVMGFALSQPHDGREALFTILGASLLALAHYLNRRALA